MPSRLAPLSEVRALCEPLRVIALEKESARVAVDARLDQDHFGKRRRLEAHVASLAERARSKPRSL